MSIIEAPHVWKRTCHSWYLWGGHVLAMLPQLHAVQGNNCCVWQMHHWLHQAWYIFICEGFCDKFMRHIKNPLHAHFKSFLADLLLGKLCFDTVPVICTNVIHVLYMAYETESKSRATSKCHTWEMVTQLFNYGLLSTYPSCTCTPTVLVNAQIVTNLHPPPQNNR